MDLDEMLREHQRWLERAHKSLTSAAADAPADLTQPRIEQLRARIAELERQKEREVRRYDAAINELKGELAVVSPAPPVDDQASRPEQKPSKKAKAKKSKK